jgi:hypothetical protein
MGRNWVANYYAIGNKLISEIINGIGIKLGRDKINTHRGLGRDKLIPIVVYVVNYCLLLDLGPIWGPCLDGIGCLNVWIVFLCTKRTIELFTS